MYRTFLSLISLLLLATSCAGPLADKPQLTVSIEPLRYFVDNIGGDNFQVSTLVPAGASPETYELTPQQVVEVSNSRAYFSVGTLGFEQTRLKQLVDNNPGLLAVNVSDSIALLTFDHSCCEHHGHDHSKADGESIDLHTWASASSARHIAKSVCRTLIQLDSINAPLYQHRTDSLLAHIDSIDIQVSTILRPLQHRAFLIYHPALGYYARDYGLQQFAVERDGKEPSPEQLKDLINQVRTEGIKVVFIQQEHAGRAARRVAEATGTRIVSINPLAYDWDQEMLRIAKSLAE
ncbi:MAG: zinc ABC transporter substrate-binding protein [Bacteroidaceae bacterium]|nr:zinc ABC transporter substrate-binding protein [Bacteroidaceae bacterium]